VKSPSYNSVNGSILNRGVLVLNSNYAPMTICTAKRAICLNFLNKVEVLSNYEEVVKSPSLTVSLPSIIKIKDYVRYDNLSVDLNRKNLLERDNYTCQYCGQKKMPLTIDHIIPKASGGKDSWDNLVAACRSCNQKKGNETPSSANMSLRKKPKPPNRLHYFQRFVKEKQNDWKPYLFMEPFKIN
jgi:5-methylcytosine-specific restriction endonuclease McrA